MFGLVGSHRQLTNKIISFFVGFLERELKKDNIPISDNGDIPLAPLPKEMIELEVRIVNFCFKLLT